MARQRIEDARRAAEVAAAARGRGRARRRSGARFSALLCVLLLACCLSLRIAAEDGLEPLTPEDFSSTGKPPAGDADSEAGKSAEIFQDPEPMSLAQEPFVFPEHELWDEARRHLRREATEALGAALRSLERKELQYGTELDDKGNLLLSQQIVNPFDRPLLGWILTYRIPGSGDRAGTEFHIVESSDNIFTQRPGELSIHAEGRVPAAYKDRLPQAELISAECTLLDSPARSIHFRYLFAEKKLEDESAEKQKYYADKPFDWSIAARISFSRDEEDKTGNAEPLGYWKNNYGLGVNSVAWYFRDKNGGAMFAHMTRTLYIGYEQYKIWHRFYLPHGEKTRFDFASMKLTGMRILFDGYGGLYQSWDKNLGWYYDN